MPVSESPTRRSTARFQGDGPQPQEFFDFAKSFRDDQSMFPAIQLATITITGDVVVTGPIEATTKQEIKSAKLGDIDSMQCDVRATGNKPRIVVQVDLGTKTATLTIQHGNAALTIKARARFREFMKSHNPGEHTASSPPRTMPRTASTAADAGATIDSYRLAHRLGRGFSAEVWEAKVLDTPPGVDLPVGEAVAIKIYTRLMENSTDTLRVHREFQVATSINHPNLVRVYDLVLSPARPLHNFMVMELIRGRTLKSAIPSRGMDIKRTIRIARQVCDALRALHVRDALHRDVKAANIMLTGDGEDEVAKLCDLGIVSVVGDPSMTGTSVFMGSKHSAPLEQMVGDEVDARADVYAAGSVMFHCYAGRPMYHRAGPEGAIVRKMLSEPETLKPRGNDALDEQFVAIVNRCVATEPADRPATAADLMALLEQLAIA